MRGVRVARLAAAVAALLFASPADRAHAQAGGASPGGAVPKAAAPDAAKTAKAAPDAAKTPNVKIAGNFGQWTLVCGESTGETGQEPCSLVQALVEHNSQKLVFRLTVAYGPRGNLVLRIDGPIGVALQRGLEFAPDTVKIYRLPFETCLAQGCTALLLMKDDLKQDLTKAQKGTITVYALNGRAVQAVTELTGFADGLAALDKHRQPKP